MNCQEALSLLYEIIDKEASEIDAKEVQQHLDHCRHCFAVFRLENAVQEFINLKLKHSNPSICLETLKAKIKDRLDEIDRGQISAESRPFFRRAAAVLAAAAVLVILIGAAFWVRDFYRHQTEYLPLERSHLAAADHPETFNDHTRTISILSSLRDSLSYELFPSVEGFTLVGGRSEEIKEVELAHFVYSNDKGFVSVFVAPSNRLAIPHDLSDDKVEKHALSFYDHHCRGCRLVYHRIGSVVIVTATTERTIELLDFIPGQLAI
ncbi:MAG: zf-HC2 domain-containing protein [Candidatus Zixiibacteriota bacterium]